MSPVNHAERGTLAGFLSVMHQSYQEQDEAGAAVMNTNCMPLAGACDLTATEQCEDEVL